jgi:uncharacterized protein (DUF427 family)
MQLPIVDVRQGTTRAQDEVVTDRRSPPGGQMRAIWNGTVIAESDDIVVVENNHYFPRESLRDEYLRPSSTTTVCGWKGTASYYSLEIDGQTNQDAVWYYPEPKDAAKQITDRVAFWKGVRVEA